MRWEIAVGSQQMTNGSDGEELRSTRLYLWLAKIGSERVEPWIIIGYKRKLYHLVLREEWSDFFKNSFEILFDVMYEKKEQS